MTYLLIFFTSLVTTIFLTPYLISFLKKSKIIDYPGGRKIHSDAMPRMGGLVIFLVVIVMLNAFAEDFSSIRLLIISATILIFSGVVDDVVGLNNFIKFIIQNISAIVLILYLQNNYSAVSMFGMELTSPIDYLVLITIIVGTINSINFLDGLDGLASGFAILIFSVLLVLAIRKEDVFLILINVTLIGSTLGFLRFNAFPASIFLGDTGSLVLGFFLIALTSLTSINYHDSVLDLTFPIIILGVPLVDTLKVFVIRIVRRRDPFSADTSHQHHILKKSIVSYKATVFIIELFSLVFIAISLLYLVDYITESIILFFIFSILLIAVHPIFSRLSLANGLNSVLLRLHNIPIKNLSQLIKFSLVFSSVLLFMITSLSASLKTSLNVQELVFLLGMLLILFVLTLFKVKKLGASSELNVLLNMSIFFIVAKLSIPLFVNEKITFLWISNIHDWSFYAVTLVISITLVLRWKALMTNKLFFSGTDLTIIIFMILVLLVNNILQFDLNYYLNISLLEAFIFYLWYKLVVDYNKNFQYLLTILSFVFPIAQLSTLILGSVL